MAGSAENNSNSPTARKYRLGADEFDTGIDSDSLASSEITGTERTLPVVWYYHRHIQLPVPIDTFAFTFTD